MSGGNQAQRAIEAIGFNGKAEGEVHFDHASGDEFLGVAVRVNRLAGSQGAGEGQIFERVG